MSKNISRERMVQPKKHRSSNFKNLYRSDSVWSRTTRRSDQAKECGQRGHWSLHGAADITTDTCVGGSLWSPPPLTPCYMANGGDQREREVVSCRRHPTCNMAAAADVSIWFICASFSTFIPIAILCLISLSSCAGANNKLSVTLRMLSI